MERAEGINYSHLKNIVVTNRLHTICKSGNCPNIGECWNVGTATFMILGDVCTRACKFCSVKTGKPGAVDWQEPERLALSIQKLGLKHCVITSVDRDDLEDGGAAFWAETVRTVKRINPGLTTETLIPDFRGRQEHIRLVIDAGPEVISHNLETVRRITPRIRSLNRYEISLEVVRIIASEGGTAKSGIMLGLGETEDQVEQVLKDLRAAGCDRLTIGQYLRPSKDALEVVEYITPARFDQWKQKALDLGFSWVISAPFARSSYFAESTSGL